MIPEGFVRALDGFEAVLEATPPDRWLSPSPCEGWCAVDVAGHVIAGLLVIEMRAAGRPLPRDDPTARRMAPGGRERGMLGPERPAPEGADDQARLLALFGRDPSGV
ncbi:maleylpyruvate isomerase N-terminal domain-containing protein [Actinomadura hallensis]|uniref:maleylpyruvate isomerase N-terminal domain-containing protein n=1 Tax=Actinomadura hallensis TaxID=337895 RepID=UPI0011516470|nr:maleylpyruvate isomerase N-terminal domain-containing protein [Actinomadura hallensis]